MFCRTRGIATGVAFALGVCVIAADPPANTGAYGINLAPVTATIPIDLPTALRLAEADSPAVNFARAQYRAAAARLDQADLLLLPDLAVGASYLRHDGNTQNQRGEVFTVSRSNLFAGGDAQLRVDLGEAYFQPLIAYRLARGQAQMARAVGNSVQYEAASAYLDLLQAYSAMSVTADTLGRAEQMLNRAEAAIAAGLSKTAGDANRARTEVNLRKQELLDHRARVGAASARLRRVLALDGNVDLAPADAKAVAVTLVPTDRSLDELVLTAWSARPEMFAQQEFVAAARERLRQARLSPLFPKLVVDYSGGTFGGGQNDFVGNFNGRGDLVASAFWEVKNLGFGNRARTRERGALLDQAAQQQRAIRAQVAAEVNEAAVTAAARLANLPAGETAVREALELYRKLLESSFGMAGAQPRYDPIEPLLAIQALHQARLQYLNQVIEFNRAQFRLFTALGQPAECATEIDTRPAEKIASSPRPAPPIVRP